MEAADFIIPFDAMGASGKDFQWEVSADFFKSFDNESILDSSIVASAHVAKTKDGLRICLSLEGVLTVSCDRCGEPVDMPVDESYDLVAIPGAPNDLLEKDGMEVLALASDEVEVDLSQTVYDYCILALPIQCFHDDCEDVLDAFAAQNSGESENRPFAGLGDLIK